MKLEEAYLGGPGNHEKEHRVERKALKFLEQGRMGLGRIKVEGRKVPAVTIELFSKEMK